MNASLPETRAMQAAEQALARLGAALDRRWPPPRLRFDLRGQCAGQALPATWTLRLNRALLLAHEGHFLAVTVPHEVAHLVAYALHGPRIRPHGPEWRELMQQLGLPPKVCHDYPVKPARRARQWTYRCACQEHRLGSQRHRRASEGRTIYRCRRCGDVLHPVTSAPSLAGAE